MAHKNANNSCLTANITYLFTKEFIKAVTIYNIVYLKISFKENIELLKVQYLFIINPTIEPHIKEIVFAEFLSIPKFINNL